MCLLLVYRSVWSFKFLHLGVLSHPFTRAEGKRRAVYDSVAVTPPPEAELAPPDSRVCSRGWRRQAAPV